MSHVERPLVTVVSFESGRNRTVSSLSRLGFYLSTNNVILRSNELEEGQLLVCNVYYSRSILINYRKGNIRHTSLCTDVFLVMFYNLKYLSLFEQRKSFNCLKVYFHCRVIFAYVRT